MELAIVLTLIGIIFGVLNIAIKFIQLSDQHKQKLISNTKLTCLFIINLSITVIPLAMFIYIIDVHDEFSKNHLIRLIASSCLFTFCSSVFASTWQTYKVYKSSAKAIDYLFEEVERLSQRNLELSEAVEKFTFDTRNRLNKLEEPK